jgi:hypothetical protein
LKILLMDRNDRKSMTRNCLKPSDATSSDESSNDEKLLDWYNSNILKQVHLNKLHLLQRLNCPTPEFVCFVRVIEFIDLPIPIKSTTVETDHKAHKTSSTSSHSEGGNMQLICRLRVGSKMVADKAIAWRHSPLVNESVWVALHDFGEQFELSVCATTQTDLVDTLIDHGIAAQMPFQEHKGDPKVIGSIQFPILKCLLKANGFRAEKRTTSPESTVGPESIEQEQSGPALSSDLDFFAGLGQLNAIGSPDSHGTNGRDIWLPLNCKKGGMVHLQLALFELTNDANAMVEASRWNAALAGNPFVRHRRLPIAVLCVYVDRLQVTSSRETETKKRSEEMRSFDLSASVRRQVQRMTNHKLFWQQQLVFVLHDPPFEDELVLRLHDVSPDNHLSPQVIVSAGNATDHRSETNESTMMTVPSQTSSTTTSKMALISVAAADASSGSSIATTYRPESTKRVQRQMLGLISLTRLQAAQQSDSHEDTASLVEQLPMYVSADESILEQLRVKQKRNETEPDIMEKLKEFDSPCEVDQATSNPTDRLTRDYEQFGVLHLHLSLRFVRPNSEAMHNLMASCALQSSQDAAAKGTVTCTTGTTNACCGCSVIGCSNLESCATACLCRICVEPTVQRKPREDVKDSELVKLIKQRIDSIQMSAESGVCQVKLRFRLLDGNRLEVVVEQAVNVPQVCILSRMDVRVQVELWKGKLRYAPKTKLFIHG